VKSGPDKVVSMWVMIGLQVGCEKVMDWQQ